MAVESFLTPTDVKKTVEKKVKPKLSTEELTTIESPGKPVLASYLEKQKRKSNKKRTTKKAQAEEKEVKIEKPKKDSILIITEKPQAAFKIAYSLAQGNLKKYSENNVPFYELKRNNKNIIVASAVGHLFNLTYSKGQRGWPIFKTEWHPSYNEKGAAFTKNYYLLLKKLAKRAKEVIIATDYDIEGEVIGWNVLRFIIKEKDAKRMKYSTLTKAELEKSFEKPLLTLDWGQAYAGETRHLIDWLYGINLSRALMSAIKRTGSFRILSIGRVQGPALKIIVDRDKEIASFVPKPYWQVLALSNGIEFRYPKDIFKKQELEPFKVIKEALAQTTKKEERIKPPVPFDLTSLQREAHNHYRISPSKTLQIAQSLYLDSIISYPRTSSQKIPKEIEPKKILNKLKERFKEAEMAIREHPIEGKKTDPAHPSIYPTGELKTLSEDEKKIYELIVKRFISAFSPDLKTANKRITLTAKDKNGKEVTFTASGLVVLDKGWTKVYPTKLEEKNLPDIEGPVSIEKINFLEKETQPPKRYTSASLVSLLDKKDLGTKATRSMIVDTLYERGYLDGKSIQPTPLGKKLIEAMEKFSPIIIDEALTRNLEKKMEEIQNSKEDLEAKEKQIIENVKKVIADISKDFKAHEREIGKELLKGTEGLYEQQKENNTIMQCQVCKQGNLTIKYSKKTNKYFVACDRYPECKATYNLPPNALIKKTEKVNEEGLPILIAIRKGKRPWEFTFDPFWKEKQDKEKKEEEEEE